MQESTHRRISMRIPVGTYRRVEEARWIRRKSITEVIVEALDEYCNRHGIVVEEEPRKRGLEAELRDPTEELAELLNS